MLFFLHLTFSLWNLVSLQLELTYKSLLTSQIVLFSSPQKKEFREKSAWFTLLLIKEMVSNEVSEKHYGLKRYQCLVTQWRFWRVTNKKYNNMIKNILGEHFFFLYSPSKSNMSISLALQNAALLILLQCSKLWPVLLLYTSTQVCYSSGSKKKHHFMICSDEQQQPLSTMSLILYYCYGKCYTKDRTGLLCPILYTVQKWITAGQYLASEAVPGGAMS